MSSEIILSLIANSAIVLSALFGGGVYMDKREKRRHEATKREITNDHPMPMREDLDRKFDGVYRAVNRVSDGIFRVEGRVLELRTDFREHLLKSVESDHRLDEIEDTMRGKQNEQH